jgi:hypothetical protein
MMSFTFYKQVQNDQEKSKVFLQTSISDHKVWKSKDLWKACIFETIFEDIHY